MSADIDIDFGNRDTILKLIKHVPARQQDRRHNSGVYVTPIPVDPVNRCASIDYKTAEDLGYFKIDFLNVHVYEHIKDQTHYDELMSIEPPWHRLHEAGFVEKIIHINNYASTLKELDVNSIPRLAMFLAMIRPGKKHLIGKPWKEVAETIWDKTDEGYTFKKAHGVAYAHLVALHMNIVNQLDEQA
jgi:hypothetical protein